MPSWSGLFDGVHGQSYTLTNSRSALQREISNVFEKFGGQVDSALAIALCGAAPGATATRTRSRIRRDAASNNFDLGGRAIIETQTMINRTTNAADRTALQLMFNNVYAPTVYPIDRSGNGGGGKAGSL
jgi:hypothetical protein